MEGFDINKIKPLVNEKIYDLENFIEFQEGIPFEVIYKILSDNNVLINEIFCLDGKFVYNFISLSKSYKLSKLFFGFPKLGKFISNTQNFNDFNNIAANIKVTSEINKNLRFKCISRYFIEIAINN